MTQVADKTTEAKRSLSTDTFEDAISLEIEGLKDFDVDKSIASMLVSEITSTSLTVQVLFSDLNAISSELREPDTLILTLDMPHIFIDAETGEPLSTDPMEFKLPVGAQYT